MPVPQITLRLKPEEKCAFEVYAKEMALDVSEVLRLLITRERYLQRLKKLAERGATPQRSRQPRGTAVALPTITAHLASLEERERFDAYATSCGLSRDKAARWLVREELADQWLRRALSSP